LLGERIDNPDRVLLGYVVFQPAREQCVLRPFLASHVPTHRKSRQGRAAILTAAGRACPGIFTVWFVFGQAARRADCDDAPDYANVAPPRLADTMARASRLDLNEIQKQAQLAQLRRAPSHQGGRTTKYDA